MLATLDRHDLVGPALYDSGPYSFYSRTGFIKNVADLRGRKIWIQRGDTSGTIFRAVGAKPVTIPQSQLYAALHVGAVDVVEGSLADYLTLGLFKVAPYFSVSRHGDPPSVLLMSKKTWLSLTKDDRHLLQDVAAQSARTQRLLMEERAERANADAVTLATRVADDIDRESFRVAFTYLFPLAVRDDLLERIQRVVDYNLAQPSMPQ